MQKKTVIALTLLCIALLLIAGCSSSSGSTASAPAKTPVKTVRTTIATVPLEISPADFSGSGDDVQSFTVTGSGLAVFTMEYTGQHNFIVELKDDQGDLVAIPANEIGSYSGKKSQKLTPGKYTLDVKASGPWSVSVSPV